MDGHLTSKQRLFIDAYVSNGFNATQSAIDAGYSKKTARSIGQENLTKPDIEQEIARILDEKRLQLQRQFIIDAEKAVNVLNAVLNDPNASNRDRITAAKDILDRAGFKATERRELDVKGEIKHETGGTVSERIKQYTKIFEELADGEIKGSHEGNDT